VKTAVSIPDSTFDDAERVAAQLGWSRSRLYTMALREFLAGHAENDPVTAALDRLAGYTDQAAPLDVGRSLIESGSWEW